MGMIGIAGTGRMGTAFARRLIETGHQVAVWNRTPLLRSRSSHGSIQTSLVGPLRIWSGGRPSVPRPAKE